MNIKTLPFRFWLMWCFSAADSGVSLSFNSDSSHRRFISKPLRFDRLLPQITPSGFIIGTIWISLIRRRVWRSRLVNKALIRPSIMNDELCSPGCYLALITITGFWKLERTTPLLRCLKTSNGISKPARLVPIEVRIIKAKSGIYLSSLSRKFSSLVIV